MSKALTCKSETYYYRGMKYMALTIGNQVRFARRDGVSFGVDQTAVTEHWSESKPTFAEVLRPQPKGRRR